MRGKVQKEELSRLCIQYIIYDLAPLGMEEGAKEITPFSEATKAFGTSHLTL